MEPKSTKTDSAVIDTHTTVLIHEHESLLEDLCEQGKERNKRLTTLETKVKDDNTLIFDTLGIKLKDNGERKKQIQNALDRISTMETLAEYKETKEETIFAMVYETRDIVMKFKGYMEGLEKGEENVEKKIVKQENALNMFYNRYQTWIDAFAFAVVIMALIVTLFKITI